MSSLLIFHRPDICSTTSLESSRTSMRASGSMACTYSSPAIAPRYSAKLFVSWSKNSAISTMTLPAESLTKVP